MGRYEISSEQQKREEKNMNITSGKVSKAVKCVLYGVEGIGKSTFASRFPDPLFTDTEGSTAHLDVKRFDKPTSWALLKSQVKYVKENRSCCTYVVDTADWAESLCKEYVTQQSGVTSIEKVGGGYGKGYTELAEEWGRFLNALQDIVDIGINVVITAHAKITKFEQPDELGAYDRWELKLEKKTAPMTKEWADMVLFANYKTVVVNVDGQGATKGKNKAQGGKRVMYTTHHTAWDAKNRVGLPEELPFEYNAIAAYIPSMPAPQQVSKTTQISDTKPVVEVPQIASETPKQPPSNDLTGIIEDPRLDKLPRALVDLMKKNSVSYYTVQRGVESKGFYAEGTPIENYKPEFINGMLIAQWDSFYNKVIKVLPPLNVDDPTVPY